MHHMIMQQKNLKLHNEERRIMWKDKDEQQNISLKTNDENNT